MNVPCTEKRVHYVPTVKYVTEMQDEFNYVTVFVTKQIQMPPEHQPYMNHQAQVPSQSNAKPPIVPSHQSSPLKEFSAVDSMHDFSSLPIEQNQSN